MNNSSNSSARGEGRPAAVPGRQDRVEVLARERDRLVQERLHHLAVALEKLALVPARGDADPGENEGRPPLRLQVRHRTAYPACMNLLTSVTKLTIRSPGASRSVRTIRSRPMNAIGGPQ